HRMYLPLAGVVALVAMIAARVRGAMSRVGLAIVLAVAVILSVLTVARNAEYRTSVTLWRSVAERAPTNPRAFPHYGEALQAYGRLPEAVEAYRESLRRHPGFADSHHNLGQALLDLGDAPGAIESFRKALELRPNDVESLVGLAGACIADGDPAAAE